MPDEVVNPGDSRSLQDELRQPFDLGSGGCRRAAQTICYGAEGYYAGQSIAEDRLRTAGPRFGWFTLLDTYASCVAGWQAEAPATVAGPVFGG